MENKDFEFKTLPVESQDETITKDDFKLVDNNERVHEQKFHTKPTTFFRDSMKRFSKNKSSVVAAGILGTILLLSVFVPLFSGGKNNDNTKEYAYRTYLEPKLFNAGTGFWDGTKKITGSAVDVNGHPNATTEEEKQDFWWPQPNDYIKQAVSKKVFSDYIFTSNRDDYAFGGYVQFGINGEDLKTNAEMFTTTYETLDIDSGDIYLKTFDVYDLNKLIAAEGDKAFFPKDFEQGEVSFAFNYYIDTDDGPEKRSVELLAKNSKFDVSSLNLTDIIRADDYVSTNNITVFKNANFSLNIDRGDGNKSKCVLVKTLEFETENELKDTIEASNFNDANELMYRATQNKDLTPNTKYWSCTGTKDLHMARIVYCDFVYDLYEATFGEMEIKQDKYPVTESHMNAYKKNKWCNFSFDYEPDDNGDLYITDFKFERLSEKCPVTEISKITVNSDGQIKIYGKVIYYRYFEFDSMPRYIMGTDKGGRDMFKYVFEGLRTSLLLGIVSFAVCFIIGLIYGSISGYFGGTVDLIMERITDVLSGLPWIVVMTLTILHLGQNFFTFGLSICLTGWISTASRTRTQFYRFRGREYVLASRSLGASDARLIAKHILPNAMGTIITSSVLMIPSVIFSEATISYLGLGLKGMSSLGVILSDNQTQLTIHPYLLIFPAVVIALLMISFNLFGNGLRDAVNPSLKGEEQ